MRHRAVLPVFSASDPSSPAAAPTEKGRALEKEGHAALAAILGYRFSDPGLLDGALTHPSVADRQGAATFERLEFLGDRVLGVVIAEMLFLAFPKEREGELARRFTHLVRRETLSEIATASGLAAHLHQAVGSLEGGRKHSVVLADTCEAVIGALYLDGGLAAVQAFIERYWRPLIRRNATPPKDAKTTLQEWVLARGLPLPSYRTVATEGPPHARLFTIEARAVDPKGHLRTAQGQGGSKRLAEQSSAEALMQVLTDAERPPLDSDRLPPGDVETSQGETEEDA